jgi:putative tricarboxylic transport membrane protein
VDDPPFERRSRRPCCPRRRRIQKASFDPVKDFTCILNLGGYTLGAVVKADGPCKTWSDVIAFAKANPGKVDQITAQPRLTFDRLELLDGLGLVPIVMGLFGVAEILSNLEKELKREVIKARIGGLWPSLQDWAQSKWAIVRGTVLGFFLGILPGGGAVISSFASYAIEKKVSKTPERFGQGAIEGVAGPEAANNAAAGGAFIPLMTLGIPPNVVMALLLGAFIIHGLQPGPLLMTQKPQLFWGIVASMYIGNAMLLVLNMPQIGMWV